MKIYANTERLAFDFGKTGLFRISLSNLLRGYMVVNEIKKAMLGFFKKKSPKEKLLEQHKELLREAYELSHTNRKASDQKIAEAERLMEKIEEMG